MLQHAHNGYGCPGREEVTSGEAGCQTFPVFQAIQTEEHGTWGNHKDPSQETGPRPHVPLKDKGPDVRKHYDPPQYQDDTGAGQASSSQMKASQPGHSPLTEELLTPGEDVTTILNYQDDVQEDPEIARSIANIPPCLEATDVEMQDVNAPPGFEPEFSHSGYDVNLV